MSAGLRFAGVSRRFGERLAVDSLELACRPGELTCLVGPNGAGKSTALAMAAGLLAPSAGTISFADRAVRPEAPPETTGYLPQRSAFHPSLKVGEVVDFTVAARAVRAVKAAGATADAGGNARRGAIEVTRLNDVLARFVGELSGGWVRRLGLFSALLGSPSLLLLDEPFVGLDPETHDRLLDHLRARLGHGATVVMASHDFEVLDPFRPAVAVLDEGRLRLRARVGDGGSADRADRADRGYQGDQEHRGQRADPDSPAGRRGAQAGVDAGVDPSVGDGAAANVAFTSCRRAYRSALTPRRHRAGNGPRGAPGESS